MPFANRLHRLLPPHLVGMLIAVTVAVGLSVPIVGPPGWPWRMAGVLPLLGGAVLTVRSAAVFARRDTNIRTFDEPGELVIEGAFVVSRNPMYLGFVVMLVGVAVLVGTATSSLGPLLFWLAADKWYIPFEERRMRERFGPDYEAYAARVRRWLTLRPSVAGDGAGAQPTQARR